MLQNPLLVACGGQAFIATLLFDSSMSALPTPILHKGLTVRLFTY